MLADVRLGHKTRSEPHLCNARKDRAFAIITAVAAIITALTGTLLALDATGLIGARTEQAPQRHPDQM